MNYQITKETLDKRVARINLRNKDYSFSYSNFGMAVVGRVLEKVYKKDFKTLINDYIQTDLQLKNTKISDGLGKRYWRWKDTDAQGMGWIIDTEHNIIWHNGATSHYNSYIGFDADKRIGVIVLSNLSSKDKIPATVMGANLLQELQEADK